MQSSKGYTPVRSAAGVTALLAISHGAVALTALWIAPVAGSAIAVITAMVIGELLTATLQRTLWQAADSLDRLNRGLPITALSSRWHGPLAGLMEQLDMLSGRDREVYDLRRGLLEQTREAAAQSERNRLARDLHDSIKQQIFSISMSAAAAQARAESDPEGAKAALTDVRQSAQEAMVEMTALLQQLSPAPLEKVGLVQAIRDQAAALGYRTGAEVAVEIGDLPDDDRLPLGAQESLFRIVQEALSNVARHARAEHVTLRLALDGAEGPLTLEVRDDGQGFEVGGSGGMGLTNIRQRVGALGGSLALESTSGTGTALRVRIPLVVLLDAQENKMDIKTDHTINKIIVTGLAGGLALIAALYYPLYVLWPGQVIADWPLQGSPVLGLILDMLAIGVVVATGYLAARWIHRGGRGLALAYGAAAGGIAALIAFVIIGAPAAGVGGAGSLLRFGMAHAESEAQEAWLAGSAVVGTITWGYAALWGMVLGGMGLGAVGGLFAPSSDDEPSLRDLVMSLMVVEEAALLTAMLTLGVNLVLYPPLQKGLVELIPEMAPYQYNLPPSGAALLAVGTSLLIELGLLFGSLLTCRAAVRLELQRTMRGFVATPVFNAIVATLIAILLIITGVPVQTPLHVLGLAGAALNITLAGLFIRLALSVRGQVPASPLDQSASGRIKQALNLICTAIFFVISLTYILVSFLVSGDDVVSRVFAGLLIVIWMVRILWDRLDVYSGYRRWGVGIAAVLMLVNIFAPGLVGPLLTLPAFLMALAFENRRRLMKDHPELPPAHREFRAGWHTILNAFLGINFAMVLIAMITASPAMNMLSLVIGSPRWSMNGPNPSTSTLTEIVQKAYYTQASAAVIGVGLALAGFGLLLIFWRAFLALLERDASRQQTDMPGAAEPV